MNLVPGVAQSADVGEPPPLRAQALEPFHFSPWIPLNLKKN